MIAPTTAEVRAWSKIPFDELEYPPADPDPLDVLVARSIEYVEDVTGRKLDSSMPSEFTHTANEAVQRRVEQLVYKASEDQVETAADDLIQSASAGSVSETKRDPGALAPSKLKLVNPWPHLADLLWRLMTEDKRDEWNEVFGQRAPHFEVSEVDWDSPAATDPFLFGA